MPITNFRFPKFLVFNRLLLQGVRLKWVNKELKNWCSKNACEKWCKNTITACHFYAKMKTSQMCIKNAILPRYAGL